MFTGTIRSPTIPIGFFWHRDGIYTVGLSPTLTLFCKKRPSSFFVKYVKCRHHNWLGETSLNYSTQIWSILDGLNRMIKILCSSVILITTIDPPDQTFHKNNSVPGNHAPHLLFTPMVNMTRGWILGESSLSQRIKIFFMVCIFWLVVPETCSMD